MAGQNDFLPFATTGGTPNVDTQAAYATEVQAGGSLQNGYQANAQAPSSTANKTWRQSSFIAAMIGQFISTQSLSGTFLTAKDDGNQANILAAFENALLIYLGQNFLSVTPGSPFNLPVAITLPGGLILQIGATVPIAANINTVQAQLAIPWPNGFIWGNCADSGEYCWSFGISAGTDQSHVTIYCDKNQCVPDAFGGVGTSGATRAGAAIGHWFAVGY
jgi:hypothetical protein